MPMTAAGGLYTSVADLGRFLSFQLSDGSIDGRVVLEPEVDGGDADGAGAHEGAPAG